MSCYFIVYIVTLFSAMYIPSFTMDYEEHLRVSALLKDTSTRVGIELLIPVMMLK